MLVDGLHHLVVEQQPTSVLGLDDGDVVAVVGIAADVHDDGVQLIDAVGVLRVVRGVEHAQIVGIHDPVEELLQATVVLRVLETLQMQSENLGQLLDLHALLGFLQAAAVVAMKLVALAQHLLGGELLQARRDRRVLLEIDGQI